MKVIDLLEEIERGKKEYPDFLDWDVYTEQLTEGDKEIKRKPSPPANRKGTTLDDYYGDKYGQEWEIIKESPPDEWEYFYCAGFWSKFIKDKIFTINVNY